MKKLLFCVLFSTGKSQFNSDELFFGYGDYDYGLDEFVLYDYDEDIVTGIEGRKLGDNCDQNRCKKQWACPSNSNCINKCIGYSCQCKVGFIKKDKQCKINKCDEDQCSSVEKYGQICPAHSTCVDKCSQYDCICDEGREMKNGVCRLKCPFGFMEMNGKCEIICPVPACNCAAHQRCEIEKNKYGCDVAICNCTPEYRKNDQNKCVRICPVGYQPNTKGTCEKICPTGYQDKGGECVKSCLVPTCNCPKDQECEIVIRKDGCEYAECTCVPGFIKLPDADGNLSCQEDCDEDQCRIMETEDYIGKKCPENSECLNRCTLYECVCKLGFQMIKGICVPTCDENQCSSKNSTSICPQKSTCIDDCDGFHCFCDAGYKLKDSKCVSICDSNQCLSDYKCPLNSLCTDKCDGYDCHCQRGFQMVENVCKPVRQNVFAETAKPERHRKPKKNSNSHKQYSSMYGDPHYHISGISETQPDLCFDLNDEVGAKVLLIRDHPLEISGKLYKPEENSGIYFKNLQIISMQNVTLNIDSDKYSIDCDHTPVYEEKKLIYDDLSISDVILTKKGYKFVVGVGDDLVIEIQIFKLHKNVNMRLLEQRGISNVADGIIGQLLRPGVYTVTNSGSKIGQLNFKGITVPVKFQRHAWNTDCWYVSKSDAKMLFDK